MESIFQTPWASLGLPALEAFLAEAEREALLWEAKGGGARPRPDSIQKHVCGFANRLGGYLILGADEQDAGRWELRGIEWDVDEPEKWIGDCIGALRSPPYHDVRLLPTSASAAVVVVQVERVAVPPCMTPSGTVYQRVSGATKPVLEPLALLDLTSRGRELEVRAAEFARDHALALLRNPPTWPSLHDFPGPEGHPPSFSLALKALGPPPDIAARPFRGEFFNTLQERAASSLSGTGPIQPLIAPRHSQGASWASVERFDATWLVFAHRDGTIALSRGNPPDEDTLPDLLATIEHAWALAVDLLHDLGCRGEARFCLAIEGTRGPFRRQGAGQVIVERSTSVNRPEATMIASVKREVERATGRVSEEPNPT
jgi:hypothetical protein